MTRVFDTTSAENNFEDVFSSFSSELRRGYSLWEPSEASPPLEAGLACTVPVDLRDIAQEVGEDLPRRYGVIDFSWPTPRLRCPDLRKFSDPTEHELTARLHSRHKTLMRVSEMLVVEHGRHMSHWFGRPPPALDWIVTTQLRRPRRLGYLESVVEWTLDEALTEDGWSMPSVRSDMPQLWIDFVASAIKWDIAVHRDLRISHTERPPRQLWGRPFSRLPNPFVPILHLWRCGVMVEYHFGTSDEQPAALFVHAVGVAST